MMKTITNSSCTGCGACAMACPQKCIEMKENKFGELTPFISENYCLKCGKCERVCPQNTQIDLHSPVSCFAAWSKTEDDWVYSASGGVGAAIIRYCAGTEMTVYCCDYDKQFRLFHFPICTLEDIPKAQSSKYSQSAAFVVFEEIRTRLYDNEKVVFIGTPCQVAGLRSFLGKVYDNLVLIDLVCHGTPPTRYLREHLKHLGLMNCATKIRFRGEYDQVLTVWDEQRIVYQKGYKEDSYFSAFYANAISRDSCYECKYAKAERAGDITIGDFWGLHSLNTMEPKSERPSLVLINTERGEQLFKGLKQQLFFEERACVEGIRGNGRLKNPPGKNREAKYFRAFYPLLGFENALRMKTITVKIIKAIKK